MIANPMRSLVRCVVHLDKFLSGVRQMKAESGTLFVPVNAGHLSLVAWKMRKGLKQNIHTIGMEAWSVRFPSLTESQGFLDKGADILLLQWKNKHADGPLNAKKPKKVKERQKHQGIRSREGDENPPTISDESEDAVSNTEQNAAPKSD